MLKINLVTNLLVLVTITSCSEQHDNYTINPDSILSVHLGMSKSEVISRLGAPVDSGNKTFTYTEEFQGNYPQLWVHFDDSGRVREVYAKYYDHTDDHGVYGLSFDSTNKEFQWGGETLKNYFRKSD